jgi:PAS domain S-box-containing protein
MRRSKRQNVNQGGEAMSNEAAGRGVCRAGAIGPGKRLEELLGVLCRVDPDGGVPKIRLAALAVTDGEAPLETGGAVVFPDAAAFFAAAQDMDAVFDLRDSDAAKVGEIPSGPAVFGLKEARFWLRNASSGLDCQDCRRDLGLGRGFLGAIFDRMEDEILFLDADCRVLECNEAATRGAGLSRTELLGKSCRDIFGGAGDASEGAPADASVDAAWEVCREAVSTGREARKTAARMDEEGRLAYYRTSAYPLPGSDDRVERVAVMRRDVSKDVVLERRLQKSERLAAIGELSMFISHEIRNPLFAIAGFANALLRSSEIDEASREKAAIILSESNRLDGILKSIINFTRPTEAAPGVVDAPRVVENTLGLMQVGLEKQGVTLETDIPRDLPKARGDEDMLKQGLINIMKNSMEAMPQGGTLSVHAGLRDGLIFLRVADTGRGILPEHLKQVFNPFFSTKDKGSGLGLAMTKKVLEDMGGSVSIKSESGRGTAVTLFLPPFLALPDDKENEGKKDQDHA